MIVTKTRSNYFGPEAQYLALNKSSLMLHGRAPRRGLTVWEFMIVVATIVMAGALCIFRKRPDLSKKPHQEPLDIEDEMSVW
ncbi:MAG: hypothetical protein BGP16_00270 [Sphingobium sp. 66-54]|nr:MAG: hypothetical protein BGP16_00270 [Sphingobium sp. 66-54]